MFIINATNFDTVLTHFLIIYSFIYFSYYYIIYTWNISAFLRWAGEGLVAAQYGILFC